MKRKPWIILVVLTLLIVQSVVPIVVLSSTSFEAQISQNLWQDKGTNKNPPYVKESTSNKTIEYPSLEKWFRDKNRNKIDDFIENQTGFIDIFVHYDQHPAASDVAILSSYVDISHVYKYIDVIAASNAPKTLIETLTKLPHIAMVEWQAFTKPVLDISVPALKARQSTEYSPNTAWDLGYTGNGITIAILDSGVDNGHESFTGKFVAGYNAITGTAGDPDDVDGHGTHVAGTALGTGGSSQIYRGVAPNSRLVDVKVIGGGIGSSADLIEGIDWVISNRATFNIEIMSISMAITDQNGNEISSDGTDAVSQAVNNAANAGIVAVVAVGNSGQNIIPAPAAADNAIAVGAVGDMETISRNDDTIASFSNFGSRLNDGDADQIDELKPDIVAPGVLIMAPRVNTTDQYWEFDQNGFPWSGTSMATPHVAGVVALMLEKEPRLTPAQIKSILRKTTDDRNGAFNPALDPKYDVNYGWGIVDAHEAVELAVILWERVVISTHFSVYYNITGPYATTDEYAQTITYAFEKSWMTIVVNFGFNAPPDTHMTAYLKDLPSPLLGKTSAYYHPVTRWHVEFIEIDIGLEQNLARATAAHEFFHAVELSYDPTEADWISEGMAKWSESRVYTGYIGSSSYVEYVNSYMNNPDRALPQLSYEAVLFWIFIDQKYGIDMLKSILQQTMTKDGIYALDAAFNAVGTTFAKVFKEWTIANYFKDVYYSNGQLFNSISVTQLTYTGARIDFAADTIDWGADYYVITSPVIYMPMQFVGGPHHNLTKILIEHGKLLISDFVLFIPYSGSYWLMQANNLDKIIIIVRSLGTETSNDRTTYLLTWLSSSQTLNGPYTIASTQTNLYAKNSKGLQTSSSITTYTMGSSSSQNSPQVNPTVVANSSYKSSSAKTVYTINGSGQQNSTPTPIYTLNNTSSQDSSVKLTTVVSNSSSQASSQTLIQVRVFVGDVNGDGRVDMIDLTIMNEAYGSTPGKPNWNSNCDLNNDNRVDVIDLFNLSKNFGKTST